MAIALAGAVQREGDQQGMQFLQRHLLPLPFVRTRDEVHRYVASNKWVGSLAELLDACGVPEAARPDLVRAVRDGGQMVRDLRSMSGWSYVAPGENPPPGALEAAAVAAESVTAPAQPRALPAIPAPAEVRGFILDRDRRIAGLASAKRVPSVPRSTVPADVLDAELAAYAERVKAHQDAAPPNPTPVAPRQPKRSAS
jgi:hypothetical protein